MKFSKIIGTLILAGFVTVSDAGAEDGYRKQAGIDSAAARYGVTGRGVVIAILDRGIEWQNPDFIKPDGTTRIKALLDMSGQNWCRTPKKKPREYTERQINRALRRHRMLDTRDAVGHGTLTAGIAAGNGRAYAKGKYRGVAPEADLIIVKMTSEWEPEHDGQPEQKDFNGCILDALDWLDKKLNRIGKPAVGLINSGTQLWGPTDGSSSVSRKIDEVFGKRRPGRVFVLPSGDEGCLPTHAGGEYSRRETIVKFNRVATMDSPLSSQLAIWFRGPPASIEVAFDGIDGSVKARSDIPDNYGGGNGIEISVREPGKEGYPADSSSRDRLAVVYFDRHFVGGRIILKGLAPNKGRFDIYSDLSNSETISNECPDYSAVTRFLNHLEPGRLTDYASTKSAIIVGAYVSTDTWIDIDGRRQWWDKGRRGKLWSGSAGGPTRDGRRGVDLTAPGENIFGTYATNSAWALRPGKDTEYVTNRGWFIQGGGGRYVRQAATSGAAPIVAGAVALMLEMKPDLTSDQARALLTTSAISDENTGHTPKYHWGHGKINVRGALDRLCKLYRLPRCQLER